jgi:hypothetical protein
MPPFFPTTTRTSLGELLIASSSSDMVGYGEITLFWRDGFASIGLDLRRRLATEISIPQRCLVDTPRAKNA